MMRALIASIGIVSVLGGMTLAAFGVPWGLGTLIVFVAVLLFWGITQ